MRCLPFGLVLLSFATAAWAGSGIDAKALGAQATSYLNALAASAYPDSRATIEVDGIDPRLRLPACPAPSFRLPLGGRAWGPGTLEARCETPTAWSLFLTYRIRLRGPALVARQPLAVSHRIEPSDLILGEVEYNGDPGRYPRAPEKLKGATLTKPISAGTPVDIGILRFLPLIKAGQSVKVIIDSPGFQVSQQGIAQQSAGIGDSVKLKTATGKIIQGIVQANGTVQIKP